MDAVLESPRPDEEKCGVIDADAVQLAVTVGDELGAKFPSTPVDLAPEESGRVSGTPPLVLATRTDSFGNAVLQLPSDKAFHTYTVTVALAGFLPEARNRNLRPGCTGRLVVAPSSGYNGGSGGFEGEHTQISAPPNNKMRETKPAMARMARSSLLILVLGRPLPNL